MKTYRYTLQPYKGRHTRYTCPQCGTKQSFVRYIDTYTGQHLGTDIGRCNREQQCGYHQKPTAKSQLLNPKSEYRHTTKQHRTPQPLSHHRIGTLSHTTQLAAIHQQSLCCYNNNHLVQYLLHTYGFAAAERAIDDYRIGTHDNDTIFWQIDAANRIRAGKVMAYDKHTGKRIKDGTPAVRWVHSLHKLQGYELRQCLFGEHLLATDTRPVAIAESEKTALIAGIHLPQYLWLATGGAHNLHADRCGVLRGRRVVLFPDAGVYDKWLAIAQHIPNCTVSKVLCGYADGSDVADYL